MTSESYTIPPEDLLRLISEVLEEASPEFLSEEEITARVNARFVAEGVERLVAAGRIRQIGERDGEALYEVVDGAVDEGARSEP